MPNLGPTELILILLIVIAIFGAGKLANLGGALGKGVKDFRSAMKDPNAKAEEDAEAQKAEAAQAEGKDKPAKGENGGEEQA